MLNPVKLNIMAIWMKINSAINFNKSIALFNNLIKQNWIIGVQYLAHYHICKPNILHQPAFFPLDNIHWWIHYIEKPEH
jgi:hypothetical protein